MHVTNDRLHIAHYIELVAKFQSDHQDYSILVENIIDNDMKAAADSMLSSNKKPNIMHSWGGADLIRYAENGWIEPLTGLSPTLEAKITEGGLEAFNVNGKLYGYPSTLQQVGIWYNKALFEKAGITQNTMNTWSGFLAGVQQLKEAGITPIAIGAKDKWPVHFYWSYLAMRIGGIDTFKKVTQQGKTWLNEDYLKASEALLQLAALEPFQNNFQNATYNDASRAFGNHQAAMHLMGDWDVSSQRNSSLSGQGVSNRELGLMPFPQVEGGKGKVTDTLGGVNGWIVPKGKANSATIAWLEMLLSEENQRKEAQMGRAIPVLKDLDDALKDSFKVEIAKQISNSTWHQIYWDQALGAKVGGAINDISLGLASQTLTAYEANTQIQQAWNQR
jgi:raffinose/stachyose/melibiose transport system substrate-binding protein